MNDLKTPEQILEENGYSIEDLEQEETLLFRNPDFSTAIIGVDYCNRVIYDYEKMLEYMTKYENMTEEESADYICSNTLKALGYMYGKKPIVMFPLIE